ncbi:MAG: hypothetical protein Tsb009_30010 [Planctomycetaceae bacterium]
MRSSSLSPSGSSRYGSSRRFGFSMVVACCLALMPAAFSGDAIIQQVQDTTDVGVGFDVLTPGPHTLTMTLQATGTGNELQFSNAWDPYGTILWTSSDNDLQQLEHHWQAVGVLGEDVVTPVFDGTTTVSNSGDPMGGWFMVTVSHVDIDLMSATGSSGDPYADDEAEVSPGVGMPITHNNATLPATFPIGETSGRDLWVAVTSDVGGTLQFTGTGAQLAVYQQGVNGWEQVTGGITVPPGGLFETFMVQTSNQFTGPVMLGAQLIHSTTALNAADEVNVFYQEDPPPPAEAIVDIDVDSDNDNLATQFRPPSRTQAEDDVEETPGMTMTEGEGWAKIEVHATIPASGTFSVSPDNFSGFEFADENFNVLPSGASLFDGPVDETTVFPMIFYVRPVAGVAFDGETVNIYTNYYDDFATTFADDNVNVVFQAGGGGGKTVTFEVVDEEPDGDTDAVNRDASGLDEGSVEIRLNGTLLPLSRFQITDVLQDGIVIGKRYRITLEASELIPGTNTIIVDAKDQAGNIISGSNNTITFENI